jgi:hypothetical protein
MKKLIIIAGLLATGIVSGCGGSSTNTPTTSISGKVADGYLVGATVFMDKNSNYQLDSGEPSATTDQNGAYTLVMDHADVGRYPIVAIATKGVTIDKDSGAAVQNSYILSMPASAAAGTVNSNFISPMSSQLREMMETGKYATMQQAMSDLGAKLGIPAGTDMLTDYMAANNAAMHTAAQNMAGLMGSQMAQVLGTTGPTTTVDVNRYRGMMGTIFSNMSSIKGSGPNTQPVMSNLMGTMSTTLSNMPIMSAGQPFRNMSAAFRGGMMGGTGTPTSAAIIKGPPAMPGGMM